MFVISRFRGICIWLEWHENRYPHFHAAYGDQELLMEIISGKYIGDFPDELLELLEKWRAKNVIDLVNNWKRSEKGMPQLPIDPLVVEPPKVEQSEEATV